ncbi:MAG: hypothetical protein RL341_668 [Pseudomonadota bacterium]|jgi:uncharacterized membrane protein (UPF0127 family)
MKSRAVAFIAILSAIAALLAAPARGQNAPALPMTQLNAGMHLIKAEVAANNEHRQRGLMFREKMGVNDGMLFVFDQPAGHCMWMKNTLIPLSVAFIAEDATIINIEDMQPQKLDSHCAKKPAAYALEMNLGWFAQRRIKPGMKIGGIVDAKPAAKPETSKSK